VIYHAGTILPLHCSSLEEIFHGGSGEKMNGMRCRENIKQYKKPATVPTRSLAIQLLDIREKGFAISADELEIGVNGVAAPIRNHASRIIGLLGVVGPSFRLTHERLNDEVASLVVRAAGDISLRMGYEKTVKRNVISQ
jgi:DNA-binding IclR family transcriptional regulator